MKLTNLKYSLIIAIILTACGRPSNTEPSIELATESDVHDFIDQFMVDAKKHGLNLDKSLIKSVKLEDVIDGNPRRLGQCSGSAVGQIIQFKKGFSKAETKLTVYHELGHCMLGLGHTNDDNDIMYTYSTSKPLNNWEAAVNDLFNNANPSYTKWTTKQ